MNFQDIQDKTGRVRELLRDAEKLASELQASVSELEEPAIRAQMSVLRTFIYQSRQQLEGIESAAVNRRRDYQELVTVG